MSELCNVFREKVNKITLNADDDKGLQAIDIVISYSYATGPGRLCKAELVRFQKIKRLNMIINFDKSARENTAAAQSTLTTNF